MTTFQFIKNNMLHSFVKQVFIDSIILANKFKKIKTINKLGAEKRKEFKKNLECKRGKKG
jgi:hypothetical protein